MLMPDGGVGKGASYPSVQPRQAPRMSDKYFISLMMTEIVYELSRSQLFLSTYFHDISIDSRLDRKKSPQLFHQSMSASAQQLSSSSYRSLVPR